MMRWDIGGASTCCRGDAIGRRWEFIPENLKLNKVAALIDRPQFDEINLRGYGFLGLLPRRYRGAARPSDVY